MADQETKQRDSFVLVLRTSAGFYFGKSDPLPTMRFLTETGPTEFTFGTSRILPPGFTNHVRCGIWADVRGEMDTFDHAIETWANWARGVAALLSVAANAPVGNLTAELGYEDTPGKTKRRYWRRTYPELPLMPHKGRILPGNLALALIAAWMKQPVTDQERWHRVFNAYHHALQEWEPGLEIPALGHLWVGMEALTPLALEHHLRENGLTREALAEQWGVDPKALDAEARLRLLFGGDRTCYSEARKARNELLHGYGKLWDVRDRSIPVRLDTARYLRASLFGLVGLDQEVKNQLLAAPFDTPIHWSMVSQLFGTMKGNSDELAAPGDTYPQVEWAHRWRELPPDEEGDAQLELEFAVIPMLAHGTSFDVDRIQVLLPNDDDSRNPPTYSVK